MNGRLRVIVADDEPMALARLSRLIKEEDVEVVAECGDGISAVAELRKHRPDVAFLDIRMPGLDGLQVSANAVIKHTCVVFVTAHSEHAVHAFETDAVDYLLKPFTVRRLQAALTRVRLRLNARRPAFSDRLSLQTGARLRSVPVQAIDSLVACANYVRVYCGHEQLLARETLAALEARLDPSQFVRIHRSRVVRIGAVRDMELLPSGQYLLRLHNGQKLSGGRSYRDRLRKALGISRHGVSDAP